MLKYLQSTEMPPAMAKKFWQFHKNAQSKGLAKVKIDVGTGIETEDDFQLYDGTFSP